MSDRSTLVIITSGQVRKMVNTLCTTISDSPSDSEEVETSREEALADQLHREHDAVVVMADRKVLLEGRSNGSYLASCIIFSHLSAESSLNLSKRYKGIDNKGVDIYYSIVEDEVLPFLQQVSDEAVF